MSKFGRSMFGYFQTTSKRTRFIAAFSLGGLLFGGTQQQFHPSFLKKWRVEHPEETKDDVRIARKIISPVDVSGLNLRLYRYQTCPFCSKVRAILDYYGFSYEVVEMHPVSRSQIKFSQYKKVPILVSKQGDNDTQLNDSTLIISLLGSYLLDPVKTLQEVFCYYPIEKNFDKKGKVTINCHNKYYLMFYDKLKNQNQIDQSTEERTWREWVDNHFIHIISPNVYRTINESIKTFNWFSEIGDWEKQFPTWERYLAVYVGAAAMYILAKRLKKKHELKEDARESLYDACNDWLAAIGPDRRFLGGTEPNLADLSLYGSITAFEGCEAFSDMMSHTEIGPWYQHMQDVVHSHQGANEFAKKLEKVVKKSFN